MITIKGLEQALRNFDKIAKQAIDKVARKAIGEATKLVLKKAKLLCPRDTGTLWRSLGRKVKKSRKAKTIVGVVGPRTHWRVMAIPKGQSKPRLYWSTKYAHLVEYGHRTSKGMVAPKPFLRPAFYETQDKAMSLAKQTTLLELDKEVRKLKV